MLPDGSCQRKPEAVPKVLWRAGFRYTGAGTGVQGSGCARLRVRRVGGIFVAAVQEWTNPALALLGLALVDSINPSALLVTLYLLRRPNPVPTVLAYLAGVFTSYLTVGVLLVLGLDALLDRFEHVMWSPGAFVVQGVVGAVMLGYSFRPVKPEGGAVSERTAGAVTLLGLFTLGVAMTVAELTTALPYLAATGLLTYWEWPVYQWFPALVAYNIIFVTPPLLLLTVSLALGRRMDERMNALRARLERMGQEAALWIIGIVGFYLLLDALMYFDFFGLVEVTYPDGARSPSEYLWRGGRESG